MSARQKFFALAKKAGIEVDYNRGNFGAYTLELTAPDGFFFRSSQSMFDCSMTGWDADGKDANWAALLPELQEIINAGFGKAAA